MKTRPITTLFLLISVDGKISTGSTDNMDVDKDFPLIDGIKEGLHQYYEIEQTTDLWSLNSGRVQEKMGVNNKEIPEKSPVSFVLIDNSHLDKNGIKYFSHLSNSFVLVTCNKDHSTFDMDIDNINIIYQDKFKPKEMLEILYNKYGCERITIQSGGTLNEILLRAKLFDYIDLVIAPALIGGKDTSSLIDGRSLINPDQLGQVGVLKLEKCDVLSDSYLRVRYKVIG